ncbi:hypothetical protein KKE60_04680, partial [Patescibacteria group bacterium]|nr:hypothetical protein [Patescibacteria group bacterium]
PWERFKWALFDAEYRSYAPYVDALLCWPYDIMDWNDMSNSTPAAPHLVQLFINTTPAPRRI